MAIPFCFISILLSAIKAVIKSPLNAAFIKQPFPCRNDIHFFPVDLKTVFFIIGYNQQVVATSGRRCFKQTFYFTFTGLVVSHAPCNLD